MQDFFEIQNDLLSDLSDKKRYLYNKIDFSDRLIGLVGPRGVGKTTLLLQYLYTREKTQEYLYISADSIFFLESNLFDFAKKFYREYEGKLLIIDEIHKYKNWNQELKNIYDSFPKLNVIFSGSSSLDLKIGNYDLSRRANLYYLEGFSLREFINFNYNQNLEVINFENILKDNFSLSSNISAKIPILKYFREYLQYGYYPYFENKTVKEYDNVMETIDKTIYEDISNFYSLKSENLLFFKKIINYLAINPPGEINVNKISKTLQLDNNTVSHYLEILQRVGLVKFLLKDSFGYNIMKNTSKVFLDNSILYYSVNNFLNKDTNIGTIRENFILNQVSNSIRNICFSKVGDFKIKDSIFEVGGKNKNFSQIKDIDNSYLILDDIVVGERNKIPIWLFGFLY